MAEKRKTYPRDASILFKTLKKICSESHFRINSIDETIQQIAMSTPPSLFSYGETIEVSVQPEGDDRALVCVKSEPKVFFNITARGALERNIENIYHKLEEELA